MVKNTLVCVSLLVIQILGAIVCLLGKKNKQSTVVVNASIGFTGVTLLILLALYPYFSDRILTGDVFRTNWPWLSDIGAGFYLGIDGLSHLLMLMSTLVHMTVVLQLET